MRGVMNTTTILTANKRLAENQLKYYHQTQLTTHKKTWHSYDILPLQSWIERLWREYAAKSFASLPILLTSMQTSVLWETIIRQSPESTHLLQISSAAELAKTAWGILKQWCLPLQQAELNSTEDSACFLRWAEQYRKICVQQNWQDSHLLTDLVIEKITTKEIIPPSQLELCGFTELNPQQKKLFSTCENAGTQINYQQPTTKKANAKKISLIDQETEIYTMARFAKMHFLNNPEKKVACIFPNLEKIRHDVVRIFTAVFSDLPHFPVNISIGKKLTDYPVIFAALQLLQIQKANLSRDKMSFILRSPFIGDAEKERFYRADFDYHLQKNNLATITLNKKFLEKLTKFCPRLSQLFQAYLIVKTPKTASMQEWVAYFHQLLTCLGWPGERSLNSEEYQIVSRFHALLLEISTLNTVLPTISHDEALHYLIHQTSRVIYQPQSPEENIHILGLLEAAELPFDYIWVMGLDDKTWPPSIKPNPFIPAKIQKKYQMPHASVERELSYCQKLMMQLLHSCDEIIFSHALNTAEGKLRPSALLTPYPESHSELALTPFTPLANIIFQTRSLETLTEDKAPAISPEEKYSGGVKILKLQSACPFKAFAELRLHAKPYEMATLGLQHHERGTLVHKSLELAWKKIRDQDTLKSLTDDQLQKLTHEFCQEALLPHMEDRASQTRFFALELTRLKRLLLDWLAIEKTREPFKVITHEEEKTAVIGPLTITLRVDRIDELASGGLFIIDYKTREKNEKSDFYGERIEEPQLPIYCIAHQKSAVGIAFGQVYPGKMKLIGICKLPIGDTQSVTTITTWEQQIQQWRDNLTRLAEQFASGYAAVDPKSKQKTCRRCHLMTLCRIHELNEVFDDTTGD